ncbi:uncharacterized protein LOC129718944 [Wyeomyia smithii]|uniref:uncharacterized protein LOC129718944 n=1 Tax=Wyeomyia smithii TaxID=174621 RepID=UPI002467BAB3|nr:uncharacterized protein LOC129718944 [Wyeomyia smithii]
MLPASLKPSSTAKRNNICDVSPYEKLVDILFLPSGKLPMRASVCWFVSHLQQERAGVDTQSTVTDVKQEWGKAARAQTENLYEPIPLNKICNQRQSCHSATISDELCDDLFQLFITELPDSALAKSVRGRNVWIKNSSNSKETEFSTIASIATSVYPPLPALSLRQRLDVDAHVDIRDAEIIDFFSENIV